MELENDEKVIPCLKDMGCSNEIIQSFMESCKKNDIEKQIMILKRHRCTLLEKIHADQKQIDCLDYLLFTIKQKCQCKEESK